MASTNGKKMSTTKKVEVGAGVAAGVAAAAIGAYLLYGKNGAKNRKVVKGWALKAKGEILEQVENMKTITEGGYQDVVTSVLANYRGAKNVSAAELAALAADARKHWKVIKPLLKQGAGNRKPAARRSGGSARKTGGAKRTQGANKK